MKLGIILLSSNNVYIDNAGNLPDRPAFDKQFITDLIKNQRVLCSMQTLDSLPTSILMAADFTVDPEDEHDVNFGISTFGDCPPDLLFVVRSEKPIEGKEFRLDDYSLILKPNNEFEIWRLK